MLPYCLVSPTWCYIPPVIFYIPPSQLYYYCKRKKLSCSKRQEGTTWIHFSSSRISLLRIHSRAREGGGGLFLRTVLIYSYISTECGVMPFPPAILNGVRVTRRGEGGGGGVHPTKICSFAHAPWPRFRAHLITAITTKIPTRVHVTSRRFNHRFNGAFAVHLLADVWELRAGVSERVRPLHVSPRFLLFRSHLFTRPSYSPLYIIPTFTCQPIEKIAIISSGSSFSSRYEVAIARSHRNGGSAAVSLSLFFFISFSLKRMQQKFLYNSDKLSEYRTHLFLYKLM